ASANRTPAVHELRFGNEDLIDRAVPALVLPLVDEPTIPDPPPELLRSRRMARFGRPNEVVVRNIQCREEVDKFLRRLIGEKLCRETGFLGRSLDLLAVLVRPRQKEHLV